MVQLTGFGGVGEIGGNAFLLEAKGLRVMLDMGKRFGSAATMQEVVEGRKRFSEAAFERRPGVGDYFDDFQKPRSTSPVRDLAQLDLIPWSDRLPSLYRSDLGGAAATSAPVDMVLVSHAHVDHCGLLGLVRPDVPVGASAQTVATLASIEATGLSGWETDYTDLRVRGGLVPRDDGTLAAVSYRNGDPGHARRFVTRGRMMQQGRWTVEFHDVDHSIQGAGGFVLDDGDTRIVYSGDFRQHGLSPQKTERFAKAAAASDVLIMEGTRVGPHSHGNATDRETDVEGQAAKFIEDHEAAGGAPFVGVAYPPRDLDRLVSLHRVARRTGRRLLLNTKQAHLLDALRAAGRTDLPEWRSDPNLGVFVRAGSSLILQHPGKAPMADKARLAIDYIDVSVEEWQRLASRELDAWEFAMLGGRDEKQGSRRVITHPVAFGQPPVVIPADVAKEPGAYLFSLSLFNMTDLFEVFPDRSKAGGLYIHSQTQPHNDDMELDQFRLRRWLRAFKLNAPDHEPRRTHVSGHLSSEDIEHLLDELRPKVLVPIHNEHPHLTKERYEARVGRRAILPRYGHAETLV